MEKPNIARIKTQLRLLLELWGAEGVGIARGSAPENIQEFEERNSLLLPEEFKIYLSTVNGMCPEGRLCLAAWL